MFVFRCACFIVCVTLCLFFIVCVCYSVYVYLHTYTLIYLYLRIKQHLHKITQIPEAFIFYLMSYIISYLIILISIKFLNNAMTAILSIRVFLWLQKNVCACVCAITCVRSLVFYQYERACKCKSESVPLSLHNGQFLKHILKKHYFFVMRALSRYIFSLITKEKLEINCVI